MGFDMSIGFGARAHLVIADVSGLLYSYSCYDINRDGWETARDTEDGEIWISRDALPEPDLHERLRRLPSGRKQMDVKRIPRPVLCGELIKAGKVRIRNACGTWDTEDGTDRMVLRILCRFFEEYQLHGEPPEHISVFF